MRTTLKRGVGRGATLNGNGRAAVPPAPLGPVTVYHQPPPPARSGRSLALAILGWSVLVLAVLIGGTAGGAYLYLHESVAAVAPKTAEVKKALEKLDLALPGEPATALMIGYDHRADEGKNTPSRSDTLMLVRADPGEKTISMLSFPRDLSVEIHCPGHSPFVSKINAAYATCGPTGAVTTVRDLTGVPINYIVTVNFRGFRQLVDKLGGVWIDVDRRYFNDHGGPSGYAKINLRPGYQHLNGTRALDFVRFRHTDSDVYRTARQQLFVRAFKDQIESAFSVTKLPQVIKVVTSNVEVGQGGGRDVSAKTVLRYAAARVLPPRGAHLPGPHRRARGLRRPDHVAREHPARRPRVPQPGRRVAPQGDGRRARREAQGARAGAARDERARPERQRGGGLGLVRQLPPLAAGLPDARAAERPACQCSELRLLPYQGLLRPAGQGSKARRRRRSRPSSAPRTSRS